MKQSEDIFVKKYLRLPREWLSVRILKPFCWRPEGTCVDTCGEARCCSFSFVSALAVRCSLTPWAEGVGLQSEATNCDVFWPKSVQGAAGVP